MFGKYVEVIMTVISILIIIATVIVLITDEKEA
jgi:hypothetical protein